MNILFISSIKTTGRLRAQVAALLTCSVHISLQCRSAYLALFHPHLVIILFSSAWSLHNLTIRPLSVQRGPVLHKGIYWVNQNLFQPTPRVASLSLISPLTLYSMGLWIRSRTKLLFHRSKSTLLRDGNGMIQQIICNLQTLGMFSKVELFPPPSWRNTRRHHQLCNQFRCTYHTGHYT